MKLCPVLCGSLEGKRVGDRMNTCTVQLLFSALETITTLQIDYTPILNKKFKKYINKEKKHSGSSIDCKTIYLSITQLSTSKFLGLHSFGLKLFFSFWTQPSTSCILVWLQDGDNATPNAPPLTSP